jgi:hypothetical protein
MASNDALTPIERWLNLLLGERDRRHQDAAMTRMRFEETISAMSDRLRCSPGFIEPSEEEQRHSLAVLDRWLADHGYGRGDD